MLHSILYCDVPMHLFWFEIHVGTFWEPSSSSSLLVRHGSLDVFEKILCGGIIYDTCTDQGVQAVSYNTETIISVTASPNSKQQTPASSPSSLNHHTWFPFFPGILLEITTIPKQNNKNWRKFTLSFSGAERTGLSKPLATTTTTKIS